MSTLWSYKRHLKNSKKSISTSLSMYLYINISISLYINILYITLLHTHTHTRPENLIRVIHYKKQSRAVRNLYMRKVLYESMMPSSWCWKKMAEDINRKMKCSEIFNPNAGIRSQNKKVEKNRRCRDIVKSATENTSRRHKSHFSQFSIRPVIKQSLSAPNLCKLSRKFHFTSNWTKLENLFMDRSSGNYS